VTLRNGFLPIPKGMIAWVEVFEDEAYEIFYEPTETEISKMCEKYGFDAEKTLNLIGNRDPDVHGFMFIGDRYRAYLQETAD
jgi:hypothetical protein